MPNGETEGAKAPGKATSDVVSPTGCPVSARAAAFDPFEGPYQADPAEALRWSREDEPVFYSPALGYWVVSRYNDVKAVFRDNILFSPAIALEKITPAPPQAKAILDSYGYAMDRTMVNEDEPDHMERRRLLLDAFLPEALARHEAFIRDLTRAHVGRFVDRGRADLVAEMFREIPLTVALHFLGVPDAGAEELKRFAVAHTINTWGRPTPRQQLEVADALGRFWQTASRILAEMRADPAGEGWMYDTIRQHEEHPDIVTESYLSSMMMAILAAAHETTSNASANAFRLLLSERAVWEDLCDNPNLIPNAIEECLRCGGSIVAWRRIATADTQVGGVEIPKRGKLLIVQASANRDSRHFENPDALDPYRDSAVVAGGFRRKYSLCGDSGDSASLQIAVLREEAGRGGSAYLHDQVREGDRLRIAVPKNHFRLDENATGTLLIAGGIGITPILAMADRLKALGRDYRLHYCGRGRSAMAFVERLRGDHGDRLVLYPKDAGRRLDLEAIAADIPDGWQVYACGPERLLSALQALAVDWPEGRLHVEHFSAEETTLDPEREHAFEVELVDSGLTLGVEADQTLLEALRAAGIDLPCDCQEGLCGTCEVQVLDGEIDHRDKVLSKAERAANDRMMACRSRAKGARLRLAL